MAAGGCGSPRGGLTGLRVARRARSPRRGLVGDVRDALQRALDIRIDVVARWRGGELDRLLNAGHSAMHESFGTFLGSLPGWAFAPEVSFSIWGERGVIDILAWHAPTRSLLVIELKRAIVDVNELVGSVDRKRRPCRPGRPGARLGRADRERLARRQSRPNERAAYLGPSDDASSGVPRRGHRDASLVAGTDGGDRRPLVPVIRDPS